MSKTSRINPLLNNIYKWENSTITFLENGQMNAFGQGNYNFIDKYLVECHFGCREHLLFFNEDYSMFTSVRNHDFEVVLGGKYKLKLIPKIIMLIILTITFYKNTIIIYVKNCGESIIDIIFPTRKYIKNITESFKVMVVQ